MKERKVIVGLPIYNAQKFIAAAIEAHLAQTFGDFQLVISDNASSDATPDICASYASKDDRVTVLRAPENRGLLWNHRRVMEAIQSPKQYFRWAGGDDIPEPDLFQTMVNILDTRPDVEAVVPKTKNIDDQGNIIRTLENSLDLQSEDVYERARKVLLANYQHVIAYGLLRASTILSLRTGPNYIGWDPVFIWELALRGKMVQTEDAALRRRFHKGSISRVKTSKELRKWVEPNHKAGVSFPHWKWAYEHFRAYLASPLTMRDRLKVGAFLGRATLWHRAELARDITQATKRALRLSDEYTF